MDFAFNKNSQKQINLSFAKSTERANILITNEFDVEDNIFSSLYFKSSYGLSIKSFFSGILLSKILAAPEDIITISEFFEHSNNSATEEVILLFISM